MEAVIAGKWICDPDFVNLTGINLQHREHDPVPTPKHPKRLINRHGFFRRAFTLDAQPRSAQIAITGDDVYKLYVNGHFIGQGPAGAHYTRYFYNIWDIEKYLTPGENVIAVHVYYQGLVCRSYDSADFRQGMCAALYVDGSLLLQTDSTWQYKKCTAYKALEISGYNTQIMEDIHATQLHRGWKMPGYDASTWKNAACKEHDDHTLLPQPTPCVDIYEVTPQEIRGNEGNLHIDIGREVTGNLLLRAKGKPGSVVEVLLGEELLPDGNVRYKTRHNCTLRQLWRMHTGQNDIEFFDYNAFRYAQVRYPADVQITNIRAQVRHYPMPEDACTLESDNTLLNDIFTLCKHGVRLGTQEAYLDCPSREKGQYLGDGTITAFAQLLLTGDARMYKKMLLDFASTTSVCPGLLSVYPGNHMQEIADYSCQYPEQIINYLTVTGDRQTALSLMAVVDGLEDWFDGHQRANGLIENVHSKWNLVDWPDNLRDGYDFELTRPIGPGCHNVMNAFYYGLKKDADRLRAMLGLPQRNTAQAVAQAYRNVFFKDNLFVDAQGSSHASLHANAMALYYGLQPQEHTQGIIDFIMQKGLCCGVYMAYFVLTGLTRAGAYDQAWELMLNQGEHSWANMLREGATTCFEAWGKDQKWNTSLCHPWASAPIILIARDMAGYLGGGMHLPKTVSDFAFTITDCTGKVYHYETKKSSC